VFLPKFTVSPARCASTKPWAVSDNYGRTSLEIQMFRQGGKVFDKYYGGSQRKRQEITIVVEGPEKSCRGKKWSGKTAPGVSVGFK